MTTAHSLTATPLHSPALALTAITAPRSVAEEDMKATPLLPSRFLKPDNWRWNYMENDRGAALRYGALLPEKATPAAHIVYVEGLSEFAEKTFELARDITAAGCGFWVLDRQGQGLSGRLLKDTFKSHSTGFAADSRDLIRFVETCVPKDAPVILLSHSTGALVSFMAMHQSPHLFNGAVLSAPLLGVANKAVKGRESLIARLPFPSAVLRASAQKPAHWVSRTAPDTRFTNEDFSSDFHRNKVHDYWMKTREDLRLGAPTYGWVQSVCRAITAITQPAYLQSIKAPVRLFTAGHEYLVNNSSVFAAYKHLPDATYHHIPEARHEILMEKDEHRQPVLAALHALTPS